MLLVYKLYILYKLYIFLLQSVNTDSYIALEPKKPTKQSTARTLGTRKDSLIFK